MEVERKFRVDSTKIHTINLDQSHVRHFTQTYLTITDDGSETRVRKDILADNSTMYMYTEKGPGSLYRREHNEVITKDAYDILLASGHTGRIVHKDRYTLHTKHGVEFELDIYKGSLRGLIVAEIEFKHGSLAQRIAQARSFTLPAELSRITVEEITEDDRYKNKNLALHGLPPLESSS